MSVSLITVFLLTGGLYILWIALLYAGFRRQLRKPLPVRNSGVPMVSVIIPARNEEQHIGDLLHALMQQTYPAGQQEIMVVDDHSEDGTRDVVTLYARQYPEGFIRLLEAEEHPDNPKKNALRQAVSQARGRWILTLDADVIPDPEWLERMTAHLTAGVQLVAGPVRMRPGGRWFGNLQALEFLSLVGSGIALAGWGRPIMANGANLAFTPESFQMAQSGSPLTRLASGDDIQLLAYLRKHNPQGIAFATASGAFVETEAERSPAVFLQQRLRWASKARHSRDAVNVLVSLWVLLYNAAIAGFAVAGCWHFSWLVLALSLWVLKCICDLPLLMAMTAWSGQRRLLRVYLPLQLVYPWYITGVGVAGLLGRYHWKGRRFRGQ